jgi:hypothetical protein
MNSGFLACDCGTLFPVVSISHMLKAIGPEQQGSAMQIATTIKL